MLPIDLNQQPAELCKRGNGDRCIVDKGATPAVSTEAAAQYQLVADVKVALGEPDPGRRRSLENRADARALSAGTKQSRIRTPSKRQA